MINSCEDYNHNFPYCFRLVLIINCYQKAMDYYNRQKKYTA